MLKKKNIDNLVSRKTGTVVVRPSVAVEHPGIPETRFWTPKSCNKNRTRNVRLFPRHETPFGLELSDTKRIVLPKIIIIYKKKINKFQAEVDCVSIPKTRFVQRLAQMSSIIQNVFFTLTLVYRHGYETNVATRYRKLASSFLESMCENHPRSS